MERIDSPESYYSPSEKTFGRIPTPFEEFIHHESVGSLLLMGCTVVALLLANSPISDAYDRILHTHLTIHVGNWTLGDCAGKPIGIVSLSWLAVRLGIGEFPVGCGTGHMIGVGLLAGIGFTMSILIAELAFRADATQLINAKTAILFASLLAGITGYLWLRRLGPLT